MQTVTLAEKRVLLSIQGDPGGMADRNGGAAGAPAPKHRI